MSKIIGIDLGTTTRLYAVMQGGEPVVIPEPGRRADDAFSCSDHQGRRAAGRTSSEAPGGDQTPENTVYSIKRFHGSPVRRGGRRNEAGAVSRGEGQSR